MDQTSMDDFLLLKYIAKEKRWRIEKKDLMRFHDYLLIYFNENPLLDKEILTQMEYGEFEKREFSLIRFFFNVDRLEQDQAFLTEAFPRNSSALQKESLTLLLYPDQGSVYSDFSILPLQMEMKRHF